MNHSLNAMFKPKSIAIIGASCDASKRGNLAIRYLKESHYAGDIFPIHPHETEILGLECFPSVEVLPSTPDLSLICTPSHTLPEIIRSCGAKGIKGAVVLATGFSEMGEKGYALEKQMLDIAKEHGVRIVGPNTSGIFNTQCGANLVGFRDLNLGSIGLLSQSGNMALSLVTEASNSQHLGFSTYIGVGNEADIQFHEYLEYFSQDEATHVVIGYIEGLKNGRQFLTEARKFSQEKPIVIYKSGRTSIGQKTAQSHTGAMAGSYSVARDVMSQAGITLVERSDEILPTAETLALVSSLLPLKGKNVAVLADGGGHAAIAADSLDLAGLSIPIVSSETQAGLKNILPPAAAVSNPIDVAGGTDNDPYVFIKCAELLLKDENVDALLVVGLFGGYALRFNPALLDQELQSAEQFPKLVERFSKPILLQSLYWSMETEPLMNLRKSGIPVFQSIDTATRCLANVIHYSESKRRLNYHSLKGSLNGISTATDTLIQNAYVDGRHCLFEHEALETLDSYQADIVKPFIIRSKSDLESFIDRDDDQLWVMKIVSQDILHKTDADGVLLNLSNNDLEAAYEKVLKNAKHFNPNARIEGVLMTPMIDACQSSVEVIIGVTNDQQYGPVMMFGLGGIFVEVLKDVVFRSLPISQFDAIDMINQISANKILSGVRGRAGIDIDSLVELMMSVSSLCTNHPQIDELDLNPVLASEQGYSVLDARIILKPINEDQK